MVRIETIIFDLGGVLIDWNPRHMYKNVFESDKDLEYFLSNVCTNEWNAKQDEGRSFKTAIELKQKEFPHFKAEIQMFFSRWNEMIAGPIHGTVKILESLFNKREQRLYALTNWSAETFPFALKTFDFLKCFEGILVSGKEKLIKPNPKIYNLLLSRFDIEAEKALFIDDSLSNIETANKLGIKTIHYKSPGQLKEHLLELNISI